jgi:hypothetical protein
MLTCDKCKKKDRPTGLVFTACALCGKVYVRCSTHGGTAGLRRSLRAHATTNHAGRGLAACSNTVTADDNDGATHGAP